MASASESTRVAAFQLAWEAGHLEIIGCAHEMTAWFALRRAGDLRQPRPRRARQGNLDQAIKHGTEAPKDGRRSKLHLRMIATELNRERHQKYPTEPQLTNLEDVIKSL